MINDLSLLAAIVDSSNDAIVGVRLDGIIETWNGGAERLYGYSAREVIGQHLALLESPENPGEIAAILAGLANGETIRHHRTVRMAKSGRRVMVSVTDSPIRDVAGRIVGASAIARDDTARAALEDALRWSEERYRSLAVASSQIVWHKNARGDPVDDWPMWRAFTGQTAPEIADRGWRLAIHPDDRERVAEVWAGAMRRRCVYETEYRLRQSGGEYRHMAVRGVPILDPDGRVREWIGSCADITERKRAEEAARQMQRELALKTRFATIFLTMSEQQIFSAVLEAVLAHMQSQHGIFGYLDATGTLVAPVWDWDDGRQWSGVWDSALAEKRSLYANTSVTRVLAVPILFQTEVIGLLAIARETLDYSDTDQETLERIARDMAPVFKARLQRDAEEQARRDAEETVRTINADLEKRVQERTAQLESANHELEAFAYSVSHDLRAPLRAIHGFSRILMEQYAPQLCPEAQHYLDVVRGNALQMGKLIDDLLTFSRLSRQPLQKQPVAIHAIAAQALAELSQEIGPRTGIAVDELPPCEGDPALLKLVFLNLLSNAIKYSSKCAQPKIQVGALPPGKTRATVYFVRDNGVGFDMRYSHKLFGVFQRLHRAEEYQGTGIGLATVQRIVHRHGGRVWAESQVNQGAAFYFTLEEER